MKSAIQCDLDDEIDRRVNDLLLFEDMVAAAFAEGRISAPIHLGGGNERELIEQFSSIDIRNDWVLAGWRSHYHALLKGIPPEKIMGEILAGHSVSLCFPEHKFFCSGIVGGIAPIACGIAWDEKQKVDASPYGGEGAKVFCFLGDMAWRAGISKESFAYAIGMQLPVHFIKENNGLSVGTDTDESWGWDEPLPDDVPGGPWFSEYKYKLTRPHAGIGRWVNFK